MDLMTDPKPKRELTRPEHPKLALASLKPRVRKIVMAFVALVALAGLAFLKQQSNREQEQITQARDAEQHQRAIHSEQFKKIIPALYKGASSNAEQVALVAKVGQAIAQKSDANKQAVKLAFHLMAEPNAINLYATSSGDIYLSSALLNRMKTEGQLAAALAHGAAHVLVGDVPTPIENPSGTPSQWNYSVEQEAPVDTLAVQLMSQAGYDPNAMIGMFGVLADAYQAKADVAFFITHPNTADRLQHIQNAITALYPQGVPAILSK